MLYFLSLLSSSFGPLRLFEYVTFRAAGALFTAFLLVVLLGGKFARMLKSWHTVAAGRYEGIMPEEYIDKAKEKTPCMGGILVIGALLLSGVLWLRVDRLLTAILLGSTGCFALIGFFDDYIKVFKKDRDGLTKKQKMVLCGSVTLVAVVLLTRIPQMRDLLVPFLKNPLISSYWVTIPVALFTVVGASQAVNLTDGKDGLASGCTIFASLTYAAFAYLMSNKYLSGYLNIPFILGAEEAVIFACGICGSCIGFLWHNCHPASMFMGDTGSLALGGAIGLLAVLVRQEILLGIVGFVFVAEALSVIIQVISFRFFNGHRVFLCTPIHHHFERKNWTETQIVVRFWIVAGICALLGIASLKLR